MTANQKERVSRKRKNIWACEVCKKRKQKCDGNYLENTPCSNCKKLGKFCQYGARTSPEYTRLLELRLENLEAELQSYRQLTGSEKLKLWHYHPDGLDESNKRAEIPPYNSPPELHSFLKSQIMAQLDTTVIESESEKHYFNAGCQRSLLQNLLQDGELMNMYMKNYFNDVHSRYPFLQKSYVESLNEERIYLLCNQPGNTNEVEHDGLAIDKYILLMVYATGARLLLREKSCETESKIYEGNHLIFYQNALLLNFSDVMDFKNITSIQAMLLLVIYLLRLPNNNVIWHIICTALRMCVHFGYHRRNISLLNENPLFYLVRSKTFWSAYSLERAISNSFELPYSLNDRDIDEELPIDIDENENDCQVIKRKFFQTYPHHKIGGCDLPKDTTQPSRTSISLAVQCFHLRRLDSYIQNSLYRNDKKFKKVPRKKIFKFQKQMKNWISSVPDYLTGNESDYCLYLFNKHIRSLIQPFIKDLSASDPLLTECMKSSITVCNLGKRIHQASNRRPSSVSLQTIFLSGVTIIQGLLYNKFEWNVEISEALKSCRSVLSLRTEKLDGHNDYKTLFEKLMQKVDCEGYKTEGHKFSIAEDTKPPHVPLNNKKLGSFTPFTTKDVDLFGQESMRRRIHKSHMKENMLLFDELNILEFNGLNNAENIFSFFGLNELFESASSSNKGT